MINLLISQKFFFLLFLLLRKNYLEADDLRHNKLIFNKIFIYICSQLHITLLEVDDLCHHDYCHDQLIVILYHIHMVNLLFYYLFLSDTNVSSLDNLKNTSVYTNPNPNLNSNYS